MTFVGGEHLEMLLLLSSEADDGREEEEEEEERYGASRGSRKHSTC